MPSLTNIKGKLLKLIQSKNETEPRVAYDLWASTYDKQTNNPLVYLNKIVFDELIEKINIKGKTIVDVGCGTGALWENILAKDPGTLIGYEISTEMLYKLQKKFPVAKTYISNDNSLKELTNSSCDMIISTLVIGYIKDLRAAFVEWNRVLKPSGEIIITDLHPVALKQGATRTFQHKEKSIFIKNYTHTFDKIKALTTKMNWAEVGFIERKIDDSIKFFYEKLNAEEIYNKSYNTPILYGMHLRKL